MVVLVLLILNLWFIWGKKTQNKPTSFGNGHFSLCACRTATACHVSICFQTLLQCQNSGYFLWNKCVLSTEREKIINCKKHVFPCSLLKAALLGWISLCFQLEHSLFSWLEISGSTNYTEPLFFLKSILVTNYSNRVCKMHIKAIRNVLFS